MDELSLAHCKYECKYHIVFAPKFRRQIIYGKIKREVGKILRKLCEYKGIEILEAEACPDHIHMLVSIPPKYSVAQVMGYLKGKSSLMIFDKFANMKYKYGNRHFWCKGYYVSTVTYFYGHFFSLDYKPPNISPFRQKWVAQRKSEVNGKNYCLKLEYISKAKVGRF